MIRAVGGVLIAVAAVALDGPAEAVPVQRPSGMEPAEPADPEPPAEEPAAEAGAVEPERERPEADEGVDAERERAEADAVEPEREQADADPVGAASTVAVDSERAPGLERAETAESHAILAADAETPRQREPKHRAGGIPTFDGGYRRGILVGVGLGVGSCGHNWCDGYRAGFAGRAELGWRFGVFALVASFGGSFGPFDTAILSEEIEWPMTSANVRLFDVAGGLQVHPIRRGRFDPFFGVGLGYSQVSLRSRGELGLVVRETVRRGGVPFAIGVPIFVGERISVGPRFDVTVPFAGDVCYRLEISGITDTGCVAVKNLEEDVRVDSAELPVPWSVLLEVRAILGPWG